MNEGLIPRRYAKALLKFATEKNQQKRIYELAANLEQSFHSVADLNRTIANPYIDPAKKVQLINTAAGANADDSVFADFLKLLMKNNRLDLIRAIAFAYLEDYRKENNIYKVEIISAAPLSEDERKRLTALISKHLKGATMETAFSVDPSLIGGFTVQAGSERLDASIKNELKQLQLSLIG